jgi:UDP-N-acetylglucosamine 2-epimerase (non-hydrolysing)
MTKLLFVFGTRPEAIKMIPLIQFFRNTKTNFLIFTCVTAQHRQMLDQVLDLFSLKPDFDLDIMEKEQDLYDVTTKVILGMRSILDKVNPDLVFVHGDTTTSTATAIASFYKKIPIAHVEAGLRTGNIYSPWPEEMNRLLTARLATYHFAPTELSKENLLREGVKQDFVTVTGNTVIDALYIVLEKIKASKSLRDSLVSQIRINGYDLERVSRDRKLILITGHRRENFGYGFLNICEALKFLTLKYPKVDFVYPMHFNPNVRKPIAEVFKNSIPDNIFFIEPLDYLEFVYLMFKSYLVLTDSGGIQEEAPSLGKPVLVMRDTTERPEAVSAGTVELVGTDYNKIIQSVSRLLDEKTSYDAMSKAINPYGDGQASVKIVDFISRIIL